MHSLSGMKYQRTFIFIPESYKVDIYRIPTIMISCFPSENVLCKHSNQNEIRSKTAIDRIGSLYSNIDLFLFFGRSVCFLYLQGGLVKIVVGNYYEMYNR